METSVVSSIFYFLLPNLQNIYNTIISSQNFVTKNTCKSDEIEQEIKKKRRRFANNQNGSISMHSIHLSTSFLNSIPRESNHRFHPGVEFCRSHNLFIRPFLEQSIPPYLVDLASTQTTLMLLHHSVNNLCIFHPLLSEENLAFLLWRAKYSF